MISLRDSGLLRWDQHEKPACGGQMLRFRRECIQLGRRCLERDNKA